MRVGIALGSNVGDRLPALEEARSRILALPGVERTCLSSRVYETDPVDTAPGTGPFLNAVIEIGWHPDPPELLHLLHALQALEEHLGRPRVHGRNTPRTIDLDILYAGTVRLNLPELQIPHPRLALRRFVLAPLCDIQPDLCLPGFPQSVAVLLQNLNDPAGAQLCAHQWTT